MKKRLTGGLRKRLKGGLRKRLCHPPRLRGRVCDEAGPPTGDAKKKTAATAAVFFFCYNLQR